MNSSSVVVIGAIAEKFFYPFLAKRNITLSTCRKVSIGALFWVLTYLVMIGIDHRIRRVYNDSGEMISIGWQFFPYFLGGFGYVFTNPPQDSITYKVAPSEWKVLGGAVNKFMQTGLSQFVARALYIRTAAWFTPSNGNDNINGIENYTAATSYKFMWICVGFAAFQAIFMSLPMVERWYRKIEDYVEARNEE